jgi:hypothetical protein
MKNLNYRKKLQICRAILVNSMEDFLSSIVNNRFSTSMSAEFVVRTENFVLTQHGISYSATYSSLLMYPTEPEIYDIPSKFVEYDGAISIDMVCSHLLHTRKVNGEDDKKLTTSGFDLKAILSMLEVLREDGVKVLNDRINHIQNINGFYNVAEDGSKHIEQNFLAEKHLMKCMVDIIKIIDPNVISRCTEEIEQYVIKDD